VSKGTQPIGLKGAREGTAAGNLFEPRRKERSRAKMTNKILILVVANDKPIALTLTEG
jgi:hypothetical protein